MGAIVIPLSILMYKLSLRPLSIRLLGARRVWHGMTVTIISVHLTFARGSTSGILTLYMGIAMVQATT